MNTPDTAVELLQALVRIPSVNPDGAPGTDRIGEAECAAYVRDFLLEIGAEAELREVLPGRPNVVARFPNPAATRRVAFIPHLDTVSIVGMTIDPFAAELRDGRVWGRGASDTKGSMAAMLWALREETSVRTSGDVEFWFCGTVGEEAGQQGARALALQERFDFCVIGEPTGMQVVHAHKGTTWMRISTHGKAVHSSRPEEGVNAIYQMAEVIRFLSDDCAQSLAGKTDPVLGKPTLSVGTVRGGTKVNIVPDHCEIALDIRTIPEIATAEWNTEFMKQLQERFPGVESEVTAHSPALLTPANHPDVERLRAAGFPLTTAPWFCDACVFSEQGMPGIAIGPGSIAQAHTIDEFLSISDLEDGVEGFRRMIRLFGN